MRMKRRSLVRIIAFFVFLSAALGVFSAIEYYRAERFQYQLEMSYMRALQESSNYVTEISNTLNKGIYSGTPEQLSTFAAKLWRDSSAAKSSLSVLPVAELDLNNTYRFLSQVGDMAMVIAKRSVTENEITREELDQLISLRGYAKGFSDSLSHIANTISGGGMDLEGIVAASLSAENGQPGSDYQGDSFRTMEEGFSGYPTLIYDGPFSDHMLERPPRMLKGKEEITEGDAARVAAKFAGVHDVRTRLLYEENSAMPSFVFDCDGITVAVTKQGGFVSYMVNPRDSAGREVDMEEATQAAQNYLHAMGMDSMTRSYYEVFGDIATINFAYQQGEVTCYTDLIKVAVALDDGQIVGCDARGYLTNHHEREIGEPGISAEQAQGSVSGELRVSGHKLALIPSDGLKEIFAYEFAAKGQQDENVLVYINAENGVAEQILILIESEEGVLTV